MERNYHELIAGAIYMGGAADVEQMIKEAGVQLVVDLREESAGCAYEAYLDFGVEWVKVPLGDNATEPEAELFGQAVTTVSDAYRAGKKVAFHCGGGKGRTGTVAVGVLYTLGLAASIDEANAQATAIRPILKMKPDQRESLEAWVTTRG
jgi:protein-tyrosine phosphatase